MEKPISLNSVKMNVVSTADSSEVNSETICSFIQNGSFISAQYSGGKVQLGYLVGTINGNLIRFRYAQVAKDGRLDGGSSTGELSRLPDGRISMVEHFQWDSREGNGTNIFEEISDR